MRALREVTQWTDNTPNHTYIVNDSKDKVIAYVVDGEFRVLSRPLRFSTSKRKFVEDKKLLSQFQELHPQLT